MTKSKAERVAAYIALVCTAGLYLLTIPAVVLFGYVAFTWYRIVFEWVGADAEVSIMLSATSLAITVYMFWGLISAFLDLRRERKKRALDKTP